MASKLGYIPQEAKTLANNIQTLTDNNVLYAAPAGFHLASTATAATGSTMTVRQLMGGLIFHDPQGSAATLTTPTAAQIVAELNGAATNMSIRFCVMSTGPGSESSKIAPGTGLTMASSNSLTAPGTVTGSTSCEFIIVLTDVTPGNEAGVIYPVNSSIATLA